MIYDPRPHHRRSLRLARYDYSTPGIYFVTICAQDRTQVFGEIESGRALPNDAGRMVEGWWKRLPAKFPGVLLQDFVVMPNHLHALLGLTRLPDAAKPGRAQSPLPTVTPPALSQAVQWFKTMTTNAYFRGVREAGWPAVPGRLWQRNYYEHVVRTARAAQRIAVYIAENLERWAFDAENPAAELRAPDAIEEILASDR